MFTGHDAVMRLFMMRKDMAIRPDMARGRRRRSPLVPPPKDKGAPFQRKRTPVTQWILADRADQAAIDFTLSVTSDMRAVKRPCLLAPRRAWVPVSAQTVEIPEVLAELDALQAKTPGKNGCT